LPPPSLQHWLSKASANSVQPSLALCQGQFNNRRWLDHTNPYLTNPVSAIESDSQGGSAANKNLAAYSAASVFTHCLDGWSYASRAVNAYLLGDSGSALHLAYYAELRAACSLLAAHGVIILDKVHAVLDSNLVASYNKSARTHGIAWNAINQWSAIPNSADLVLKALSYRNHSIDDWLAAGNLSPQGRFSVEGFLIKWSMDLRSYENDRDMRNVVSYRPSRLRPLPHYVPKKETTFVTNVWRSLEPPQLGNVSIDEDFFRLSIEEATKQCGRSMQSSVSTILKNLYLGGGEGEVRRLLLRTARPSNDPLIQLASKPASPLGDHHSASSVIARAVLLLRITSAVAALHLRQGGLSIQDLSFCIGMAGADWGLWKSASLPGSFLDLWQEIAPFMGTGFPYMETHTLIEKSSREIMMASQLQRAAMWCLAG